METKIYKYKKTQPTPRKKRNLRKHRKSKHAFRMSKRQEREFFGHSFGPCLNGGIKLPYEIHVFYGRNFEEIPVTLVSDKNHGLINVECDYRPKKASQQDVDEAIIKLLSHNRGMNVNNLLAYEGGFE